MHIGTMTWSSGPKHGATTANTKRYVDFAAANGLGGVLVEGWNVGWDGDWIQNRNAFSFTQAYPDYDLAEVARYAHAKGVKLIVHNETSGGIENYERQMDSAFALYHALGLDAIKSGYVTDLISTGDRAAAAPRRAAGAHHAGQAAGPVRGALFAAADGRGPARELRAPAGVPVHPRRGGRLGHDPRARGEDRRLRRGGASRAQRAE